MIQWNQELYHYGMPRRSGRYKWGSGKDPYHHGSDGTGGKANKKEEQDYDPERHEAIRAAVVKEGQKLINKSAGLKKDFGGTYENVDDEELFELVARTKYGLSTDAYWKNVRENNEYAKLEREYAKNSRKVRRGKKKLAKYR